MTVCLAAFAEDYKAIVCVADKGISYGEHIQWDSDSTKIATLNDKGTTALFAGGEEATARVLSALVARGQEIGDDQEATRKICEQEYTTSMQELIEAKFLRPALLDHKEYLAALRQPSVNDYIYSIAKKIDQFEMDCAFLVCGFDAQNIGFLFELQPPGIATNFFTTGFQAIGSGWDKSVARLLFSEHKRTNPIHRVLYDLFDAKANAEMASGVGYEWDAQILVSGRFVFDLSEDPKKLVERVWAKFNRSPFDKRTKEDLPSPHSGWKHTLAAISKDTMEMAAKPPDGESKQWPKARHFRAVKPPNAKKSE
jgi:20S proteasome alpha/beta subunit